MSKSSRLRDRQRLRRILTVLRTRYGLNRHHNLRDAFWELVLIVISARTAEPVYLRIFRAIKARYRSIEQLASATTRTLERILKPAGLSALKARQLKAAASAIYRDYGARGLTKLGRRNYVQMEAYLYALDGVGKKTAKCVSMYACDAPSLPVDVHVWRVLSRLGFASGGRLTENRALEIEARIPANLRYAAHVLCVSLGRDVCKSRPACWACPVRSMCPSARDAEEERAGDSLWPLRGAEALSSRSVGKPTS